MLVTKSSTGTFLIEDIKTYVSHGSGTYIKADDAVKSSDLYRAINSGILMVLVDSMPQTVAKSAPQPTPSREGLLEKENQELRAALDRSHLQGSSLQASLETLQGQMSTLLAAVGRLEAVPKVVPAADGPRTLVTASQPQGDPSDLPVFVPDDLIPTNAQVRINFQTEVSGEDTTSDAVSKLRQLRRGRG